MLMAIVLYYAVSTVLCVAGLAKMEDKVLVEDVVLAILLGCVIGPLLLIFAYVPSLDGNKVIWQKQEGTL